MVSHRWFQGLWLFVAEKELAPRSHLSQFFWSCKRQNNDFKRQLVLILVVFSEWKTWSTSRLQRNRPHSSTDWKPTSDRAFSLSERSIPNYADYTEVQKDRWQSYWSTDRVYCMSKTFSSIHTHGIILLFTHILIFMCLCGCLLQYEAD